MRTPLRRFLQNRSGNVAITTALTLPIAIGALALGIDYGHLTLQKRQIQTIADLAAIAAAGGIDNPEKAALDFFNMNGSNIAVRTEKGLLTTNGEIPFVHAHALLSYSIGPKIGIDFRKARCVDSKS